MACAITWAFWFTTCWPLPTMLADADIIVAHAMLSTVYRAHLVIACIFTWPFDTPARRADAIA